MGQDRETFDRCLDAYSRRLPEKMGRFVRWITGSSSALVRIPIGLLLIAGGAVGFLPILGFWMVPLGLVLIAQDIPLLRPPLLWLLRWINRRWPRENASSP
jgi:hypothetical protein